MPLLPVLSSFIIVIIIILVSVGNSNSEETEESLCAGFTNTTANNEFTSPLYPDNYPNSIQCTKLIEAPLNHKIRLHFLENFHIEFEETCKYDFLEIRDGQFGYSNLYDQKKICGNIPPPYAESSGRYFWLRFTSDDDISYIGFKVFIEFIELDTYAQRITDEPETCGSSFKQIEGNISTLDILTPEYIQSRIAVNEFFVDCTWIIESPNPEHRIFLQFPAYRLHKPNDCAFNFVEVYGSKTELVGAEGRQKQFCGSERDPVTSKGNKLHLRFYSGVDKVHQAVKSEMSAYFSVFRDAIEGECEPNTEFDCTDNTCIDSSLRCNSFANCKLRNDEDKERCNTETGFVFTYDIMIISFLGILLISGMFSGLLLKIYRKLKQDKMELEDEESSSSSSSSSSSAESKGSMASSSNNNNVVDSAGPTIAQPEKTSSASTSSEKDTVVKAPFYYAPPKPYQSRPQSKGKAKEKEAQKASKNNQQSASGSEEDRVQEVRDSACQTATTPEGTDDVVWRV